MTKKSKGLTYEEALATLEQVATPTQRFAKAIGHASGIDQREEVRAEVAAQQEDYRERMRRALVAVAERRLEGLNDSIELVSEIEQDLRVSLRKHKDDLTPAQQSQIKKSLERGIESQIELMKELAFKPEPGGNITIDARSLSIGSGLEAIPAAFRERLRLLAERLAFPGAPSGEIIDVEPEHATVTSSDDGGESSASWPVDNGLVE